MSACQGAGEREEGPCGQGRVSHHSTSLAAFVTFVCDVNLYNNRDKDPETARRICRVALAFRLDTD